MLKIARLWLTERGELKVQSASEYLKILPVLVCRKGQVKENFMEKKIKQLGKT